MIHRPKDDGISATSHADATMADESLARIRLGLIALRDMTLMEPISPALRLLLRRLDDSERMTQTLLVSDGD